MRGLGQKKLESNPNKSIFNHQEKKTIQINSMVVSNDIIPKEMTAEQEYQHLKQQLAQKQEELQKKQKMYRIEVLKNGKIKQDIQQVDNEFQLNKTKITLQLLQKSIYHLKEDKNNKESPIFYNENGISPLELTLIQEKKHRSGMNENFVCMICFQDIQDNQNIIEFPCGDNFHKDCGIQHLLGSRFCPNCNIAVDLISYCRKKVSKEEKEQNYYFP